VTQSQEKKKPNCFARSLDASEMKRINQMTVWGARRVGSGKVKTRTLENRRVRHPAEAFIQSGSNRCPATE
jgi:hypothetical protein